MRASPQPRLQPPGTGRLLPADTVSHCQAPPWERLHFQGGTRCCHRTGREDNKPQEPVRGGRHGASGQTSSPPHTYLPTSRTPPSPRP